MSLDVKAAELAVQGLHSIPVAEDPGVPLTTDGRGGPA